MPFGKGSRIAVCRAVAIAIRRSGIQWFVMFYCDIRAGRTIAVIDSIAIQSRAVVVRVNHRKAIPVVVLNLEERPVGISEGIVASGPASFMDRSHHRWPSQCYPLLSVALLEVWILVDRTGHYETHNCQPQKNRGT